MNIKNIANCFAILMFLVSFNLNATDHNLKKTIELSKLISLFMVKNSDSISWNMGAGKDAVQIYWSSVGVEDESSCGSYGACRRGFARVTLKKVEMQHLRRRLEPIDWGITIASKRIAKFGPEFVEISPLCDTVQCKFDFKNLLASNGFKFTKLCEAGSAAYHVTAYLLQKSGKQGYVSHNVNLGSGGESTSITINLQKPITNEDLCAEAKSSE